MAMHPHRLAALSDQIVPAEDLLARPRANRLFIDTHLGDPDDALRSYRDAHIHGAVYAQIRDVFASPPTPASGTLPLPEPGRLQQQLRDWGVDADTEIVVYGPSLALAARGWWVLRWAGLQHVQVLDGGLKAWVAQGGALAQGDAGPRPPARGAPLQLQPGQMPTVALAQVEQLDAGSLLLDARDESAFLAGALPGARHLPAADQWTPAAQLRSVGELQGLYERVGALGHRDVVAYCGGGVLSALLVLTLSALGPTPRLYVGSWSEWSRDAARMARSATQGATA